MISIGQVTPSNVPHLNLHFIYPSSFVVHHKYSMNLQVSQDIL